MPVTQFHFRYFRIRTSFMALNDKIGIKGRSPIVRYSPYSIIQKKPRRPQRRLAWSLSYPPKASIILSSLLSSP